MIEHVEFSNYELDSNRISFLADKINEIIDIINKIKKDIKSIQNNIAEERRYWIEGDK
ncbi:MAG: hypothetical protein PHP92_03885 [Candidatus Nanoarchaeia archaeon]|nr:hypothetical protein [Candidatus Nanoarchaeia archaeon]